MRRLKLTFLIVAASSLAIAIFFTPFDGVTAATNVTSTAPNYFAWNDAVGWLDFFSTNAVNVSGRKIDGYASSSVGPISLDCATTPLGNICGTSNYGVCNGPGPHNPDGTCPLGDGGDTTGGALTGYAWNDMVGWISMNCDQTTHGGANQCGTSNYKVSIGTNGDLSGWAWNDLVGWIAFNCANAGTSCPPNYKVSTTWQATSTTGYVESTTYDTGSGAGGTLNSITWKGTAPNGTCVEFQVATSSNSGGPWNYVGPGSSGLTRFGAACSVSFVGGLGCAPPNTPICIDPNLVQNSRYIRYKLFLRTDPLRTVSPQVDDVILNWSR